jgi:hypothetical protein
VLDVVGFPILRHWYAVYPTGRQLSVVARTFLDYLLGASAKAGTAAGILLRGRLGRGKVRDASL